MAIQVSVSERKELQRRVRSQSGRADDARRARCILMLSVAHVGRRFARRSIAMTAILHVGRNALLRSAWPDCIAAIAGSRRVV